MAKTNDKSIYRTVREEELGLSREEAGDLLAGISPERLEKLENGKVMIRPEM